MKPAFADSGDNEDNKTTNNSDKQNGEDHKKSEYNQQSLNETKSESEHQSEDNQKSLNENSDEIDNENNNINATHNQTEQDVTDIHDAKSSETIAAEVHINNQNVTTESIDNNINVNAQNSNDSVSITVSATNQTGPKIILVNLNSTTIDVANVKYLHVMYDGQKIMPAANVAELLHTTSSDQPHYAILITQSGAQILISIPHFSTHTITIDKISKVIPAVPEFPITMLVMLIAVASAVAFYRIKPIKI